MEPAIAARFCRHVAGARAILNSHWADGAARVILPRGPSISKRTKEYRPADLRLHFGEQHTALSTCGRASVVASARAVATGQATPAQPRMKFGKYLAQKQNPEWQEGYLDYGALKELIKEAVTESDAVGSIAFSPRETSLSVQRVTRDAAEEKFFTVLESEVGPRIAFRFYITCRRM